MSFTITESNRGNPCLVHNNFKFWLAKVNCKEGSIRWRCNTRKCPAFLVTGNDKKIITKQGGMHTHQTKESVTETQIFKSACKRKAVEDIYVIKMKVVILYLLSEDSKLLLLLL